MGELEEKMVRYRAKHNIKQAIAAEQANISLQTWCSIERGQQKPSKLTEMKIRELVEKEGSQ